MEKANKNGSVFVQFFTIKVHIHFLRLRNLFFPISFFCDTMSFMLWPTANWFDIDRQIGLQLHHSTDQKVWPIGKGKGKLKSYVKQGI